MSLFWNVTFFVWGPRYLENNPPPSINPPPSEGGWKIIHPGGLLEYIRYFDFFPADETSFFKNFYAIVGCYSSSRSIIDLLEVIAKKFEISNHFGVFK